MPFVKKVIKFIFGTQLRRFCFFTIRLLEHFKPFCNNSEHKRQLLHIDDDLRNLCDPHTRQSVSDITAQFLEL